MSVHINGTPNDNGIGRHPRSHCVAFWGWWTRMRVASKTASLACGSIPRNESLNVPFDRHRWASNLSYADGHVTMKRWRWRKKLSGHTKSAANERTSGIEGFAAGSPHPISMKLAQVRVQFVYLDNTIIVRKFADHLAVPL
jgi:prepilin-type processing-associated H-X9-DG protein